MVFIKSAVEKNLMAVNRIKTIGIDDYEVFESGGKRIWEVYAEFDSNYVKALYKSDDKVKVEAVFDELCNELNARMDGIIDMKDIEEAVTGNN